MSYSQQLATRPSDKSRLRQLWLRTLLTMGIFWGTPLLITLPFVFRGTNDSGFDVSVVVLNSLTILPASILAFWHRRAASIWLAINALLLVVELLFLMHRVNRPALSVLIGISLPILLAVSLVYMEAKNWPNALNRHA